MPRSARLKLQDYDAWYHLCARAAARQGEFPLALPLVRFKLLELIQHYAAIYFCKFSSLNVMGNHWHGVCHFDQPRALSADELMERALALYPNSRKTLEAWPEKKWRRLEKRLFDVSELMRNVQGGFSRWYNRTFLRKGHFWGERFKSVILGGPQAVLDAVLYVELNAVRAGLVQCPEDYEGSSLYLREAGQDGWLMPLSEILYDEQGTKDELHARFKELVYYRGAVITKVGQKPIPEDVIKREAARGFKKRGAFAKKLRCFTDGLVLGSELYVREHLTRLRHAGYYLRRKNPVPQIEEAFFSLREQRSHFAET